MAIVYLALLALAVIPFLALVFAIFFALFLLLQLLGLLVRVIESVLNSLILRGQGMGLPFSFSAVRNRLRRKTKTT